LMTTTVLAALALSPRAFRIDFATRPTSTDCNTYRGFVQQRTMAPANAGEDFQVEITQYLTN